MRSLIRLFFSPRRVAVALAIPASLLAWQAAVTSASTVRWHDLRSVTVTVTVPGLPPPGDKPKATSFTAGHGLARAKSALNRNDIERLAKSLPGDPQCSGGSIVVIRVVNHNGGAVRMTGYLCAGRASGHIGGDLPGFLHDVGVTPR